MLQIRGGVFTWIFEKFKTMKIKRSFSPSLAAKDMDTVFGHIQLPQFEETSNQIGLKWLISAASRCMILALKSNESRRPSSIISVNGFHFLENKSDFKSFCLPHNRAAS